MKRRLPALLSCLIGLMVMLYPLCANLLYTFQTDNTIETYMDESEWSAKEADEIRKQAVSYNRALSAGGVSPADPFIPDEETLTEQYEKQLAMREDGMMAVLRIPCIDVSLPVYHGTGNEVLEKGAGHLAGTSLPVGGLDTHAVITGHTGLSAARMFTDLSQMQVGDIFMIEVLGEELTYRVSDIFVVEPTDVSKLYVEPGKDLVTLVTCTPYGVNSHRLLVRGERTQLADGQMQEADNDGYRLKGSVWNAEYLKALVPGILLIALMALFGAAAGSAERRHYFMKQLFRVLLMSAMLIWLIPLTVLADAPGAIFTNVENDSPDLRITKQVVSAVSGYAPPADAVFSFHITRDGEALKHAVYTVTDSDGNEIKRTVLGYTTSWRTDSSGDFTLQSGWTAVFSFFGSGAQYVVTETGMPENFVQTVPAGGSGYAGTVSPKGTDLVFTNVYYPPGEGEKDAELQIRKQVVYPAGCEVPETPYFSFLVEIDGEAYAQRSYTVISADGSSRIARSDAFGRILLRGEEQARIEDVPVGVDYRILEESLDGWRAVGQTAVSGVSTAGVNAASFTNVQASFAVKKEMFNHEQTDEDFTFIVTDSNGQPMSGLSWRLHLADGSLSDETKISQTGQDGSFSLKAGQTAVFFGLDKGTVYNVREEQIPGYSQETPGSDGYTGMRVDDNAAELIFSNSRYEAKGLLTVSKVVKAQGQQVPLQKDRFTMVLLFAQAEGDEFNPVQNASYSVKNDVSGTATYRTGADGSFTLASGEQAVFENLTYGIYRLIERKSSVDVMETDYREILSDGAGGTLEVPDEESLVSESYVYAHTGVLDENNLYFTVTNQYRMKYLQLSVFKASRTNAEKGLPGAVFALYAGGMEETDLIAQVQTDADGNAEFPALGVGTYFLIEKSAPAGYITNEEPIELIVTREKRLSDTAERIYLQIDGEDYTETTDTVKITYTEQGDTAAQLKVFNELLPRGSITLIKEDGQGQKLGGVSFSLTRQDADADFEMQEKTTGEDGQVVFSDLEEGTYLLTETASVSGSSLLAEPIQITIPLTLTQAQVQEQKADTSKGTYNEESQLWYFRDLTYVITNSARIEMPLAGQTGGWFWVSAAALFAGAGIFIAAKRAGKQRKDKTAGKTGSAMEGVQT